MQTTLHKSVDLFLASMIGCAIGTLVSGTAGGGTTSADAAPRLTRTIPLPGIGIPTVITDSAAIPGRLDHLAYDAATDRLFVAALQQGSLEVVDLNKGERVKRIVGLKKPQGIAVVRSAGCFVVACGGEDAVHVYGLDDLKERSVTPVGQNADNVRGDGTNLVYVGFGPDEGPGGLAVFDAAALKKVGEIPLASRPESFQLDLRSDRVFVNLPGQKRASNDGFVAAVDRAGRRTLATWPLVGAAQNFPMAFDAGHDRVLVASRKPPQVICLDGRSGAVLDKAACVADSDDLYYDDLSGLVLVIGGGHRSGEPAPAGATAPGSDAALDVFKLDGMGKLSKLVSVSTSPHARTGFFVPQRRAVYVVCPPQNAADAKILELTLERV